MFKIVPLDTNYTDPATGQLAVTNGGFRLPSDAMFPGAFVPLYGLCFNDDNAEWDEVYYMNDGEFINVEMFAGITTFVNN